MTPRSRKGPDRRLLEVRTRFRSLSACVVPVHTALVTQRGGKQPAGRNPPWSVDSAPGPLHSAVIQLRSERGHWGPSVTLGSEAGRFGP